jgi:hypothetical protein
VAVPLRKDIELRSYGDAPFVAAGHISNVLAKNPTGVKNIKGT